MGHSYAGTRRVIEELRKKAPQIEFKLMLDVPSWFNGCVRSFPHKHWQPTVEAPEFSWATLDYVY